MPVETQQTEETTDTTTEATAEQTEQQEQAEEAAAPEQEQAAPEKTEEEKDPTKVELPEVPVPPAPKPSPRMSKELEAAAAAQRRARQDRLELKRAEQALRERTTKMEASQKALEAELELATKDPFAFFEKRGVSPNALAKAFMEHKEPTESERALKLAEENNRKLEQLRKEQMEKEQQAAANAEAAKEQYFREQTVDYIQANPDRWEYINAYGAQTFVAEHVIDHRKRTGRILDVEVAADLVEKQLEEKLEGVAKTKKFSSKYKLSAAPQPPAAPAKKPKPTSLTNNVTPSQGATATPNLSEEERMKRAIDAMTFED